MTHGFLHNFDTVWMHSMKDAIQHTENGTALIVSTLLLFNKLPVCISVIQGTVYETSFLFFYGSVFYPLPLHVNVVCEWHPLDMKLSIRGRS